MFVLLLTRHSQGLPVAVLLVASWGYLRREWLRLECLTGWRRLAVQSQIELGARGLSKLGVVWRMGMGMGMGMAGLEMRPGLCKGGLLQQCGRRVPQHVMAANTTL